MPKLSEKTVKARQFQAEQDAIASNRIKEALTYFQGSVLHNFIPLTMVKSFVFIILYLTGCFSVPRAAKLAGLCEATAREKKKLFEAGQIKQIFAKKTGNGNKSKCKSKQDEIIQELDSHNYRSAKQVLKMIQEKIKTTISLTAVRNFLHNLGYKWLKCGSLPAKADPVAQRKFYDELEKPLMDKAKKGEIALIFVDAVHCVMGNMHLGNIWCKVRRFLSTFTGRMRYNVLGALNFDTKKVTTVTNDEYISAPNVVELIDKLAQEYVGIPIYLILDNAKYQRCKLVQEHAAKLGINLVFLPPYSPNLNLIERLWKFIKKELSTTYFSEFKDFCKNIDLLCNNTDKELKDEIDSLIGEEVQLFDDLIQISPNTKEKGSKAA